MRKLVSMLILIQYTLVPKTRKPISVHEGGMGGGICTLSTHMQWVSMLACSRLHVGNRGDPSPFGLKPRRISPVSHMPAGSAPSRLGFFGGGCAMGLSGRPLPLRGRPWWLRGLVGPLPAGSPPGGIRCHSGSQPGRHPLPGKTVINVSFLSFRGRFKGLKAPLAGHRLPLT